jgi:alpha-1,2-mannosyltransferase
VDFIDGIDAKGSMMRKAMKAIATGSWLTFERLRVYSMILVAFGALATGVLLATSDGLIDYQRRPLGTDFSNVYAAGKYVLEGKPAAPFSPSLQHQKEKSIFGSDTPFYGWHYPPVFLGLAAALAIFPYLLALAIWQISTLLLYLWNIVSITGDRRALLPALGFPVVFINLAHGQNGFLTAALFGGGLYLLDRLPLAAGALLGLLVYKPQYGLLIPLVLAVSGRWRVFFAATATALAVCALTYFAYGAATWDAFRDSLGFTRIVVLEAGGTGFHKLQSPFAAIRLWGGPVTLAYIVQAAVMLTVAILLIRLWRSKTAIELKCAALITGAILSTPYSLDYDLVAMAPAIAFFAAYGLKRKFLPYEKTALSFCWFVPIITRGVAEWTMIPLGLIALIVLFAFALRHAATETKRSR